VAEYSTMAASGSGTTYLTTDNLGTPRVNTNQAGSVVARHDYLPYGEALNGYGGRGSHAEYTADSVRQKYTGLERDTENDLDYAHARYYSSQAGRFTSVDPLMASASITSPQTFNRYTYALNNPYRYIDPSGMDALGSEDETDAAFMELGALSDHGIAVRRAIDDAKREAEKKQKQQQVRIVYVFVTFTPEEQQTTITDNKKKVPGPNFEKLKKQAPKGTEVRLIVGDDATVEKFIDALQDPNAAAVIFIGHGYDDKYPDGKPFTADGINFTQANETFSPDDPVQVRAKAVGIFACDSLDISGLFQMNKAKSFIGVDSGSDGLTTMPALTQSGFAAARRLIQGSSTEKARKSANAALTLRDQRGRALGRTDTDKGDRVRVH
jgi:RHS repeat-associated protein